MDSIADPTPLMSPRIHGRPVQIFLDYPMGPFSRARYAALDLRHRDPVRQKGERDRLLIRTLAADAVPIDRSAVQPRRRPGLQAPKAKIPPARASLQGRRPAPLQTRPAGTSLSPIWIMPRRNVPVVSTTAPLFATRPSSSTTPSTPERPIIRSSAPASRTARFSRRPDFPLHGCPVEPPIRLRARPAHGCALSPVEKTKLDAGRIGHTAHQPVHGIDLAHEMPLSQSADCRIAGHRPDRFEPVGHQRRPGAKARRRGGCLTAGVAAADDDDVEIQAAWQLLSVPSCSVAGRHWLSRPAFVSRETNGGGAVREVSRESLISRCRNCRRSRQAVPRRRPGPSAARAPRSLPSVPLQKVPAEERCRRPPSSRQPVPRRNCASVSGAGRNSIADPRRRRCSTFCLMSAVSRSMPFPFRTDMSTARCHKEDCCAQGPTSSPRPASFPAGEPVKPCHRLSRSRR